MFGNNLTSSWANPQQSQQQQQQPNPLFGGSTFGAPAPTNTFGGGGNPMFGNPPANNSGTTAFGAFGGTTNNAAANPLVKPATGFGAFSGGTTGAFGGGGTFGQPNNAAAGPSSLFGNTTNTTTNAFSGASTGLFGQKSAFGATGAEVATAPVQTGSSNPPYAVFSEKDAANISVTLQYQGISCMPAYRGTSFEEIRLQDYMQGRKTAGNASTFGGGTSLFGQSAQQPQQPQAASIFGAPQAPSAFGNPAPAANAPSTFGTFGAQPQAQPQQPSAFGTFGQPVAQPQQTSIFGAPPQQPTTTGFGGFANANAPKTSVFGAPAATTGGFGTFGAQPTQQQPQQQQTSLFGAPQQPAAAGGFGTFGNNNAPKTSIFGSTPATNQQPSTGLFGAAPQQTAAQQPSTGLFGGGVFGQAAQNQQQGAQPPQQQNSLFGNPNPAPAQQPAGGGIFGGGGLFNTNNNNQQQQQGQAAQPSLGMFGAPKPATAPTTTNGMFGSTFGQPNNPAAPQTSIFGNSLGQQSTINNGASLFGAKPAAPGLGQTPSAGPGGSIFGNSFGSTMNGSTMQAPGSLTASIAQPIASNLPIFAMLPEGPRAVNLEQVKKKPGFFVDVPTRSPVPRVGLGYTPANSRLRGFGSSTSIPNGNTSINGNPFSSSMSFSSGTPNALSLSNLDHSTSSQDAFFTGRPSSPSLGSGSRGSVKKLILGKKVDSADLFVKTTVGNTSPGIPAKVMFSPALGVAAREKEAANALAASNSVPAMRQAESPTPASRVQQRTPNRFTAKPNAFDDADDQPAAELKEGDYWMKPDLATIKKAGYELLSAYPNVTVGRIGYGEIEFLEPVDLTGIGKLSSLLGTVIRFDDKECSVYPDDVELGKPEPGAGLNVRARLSLVRCWPQDKATREPIKDEKHPSAVKHLKRLKAMKDTNFVSFDAKEGKWTFTVDHF